MPLAMLELCQTLLTASILLVLLHEALETLEERERARSSAFFDGRTETAASESTTFVQSEASGCLTQITDRTCE